MDGTFAALKRGCWHRQDTQRLGDKAMVLVVGQGIPRGRTFASQSRLAPFAVPTLAEVAIPCIGRGRPKQKPTRIVAQKSCDSLALWLRRKRRGFQLIAPRLSTRKHPFQDGRALRRVWRRWIVERNNAWLHNFERLVTRDDHKIEHRRAFRYDVYMLITVRQC